MTKSIKNRIEPKDYTLVSHESTSESPNLAGDRLNFFILILLYIIQGFPIGLSGAFPIILQSQKMVTYEEQVSIRAI